MTTKVAGRIATAGVVLALTTIGSRAEEIQLPTFDVVATTPLGGGEINVSQSPFAVWQTSAQDMQTFNDTTLPDALARSAPGVTVGNVSGNDFEPDLSYRGFDATAVTGTPQGLAVYQNGTRINEAFGDVVNWDLIPEMAIARMTLMPNNPLFGLNAIGGALSIDMKNGFNYHGTEAELRGGSYGRVSAGAQSGYEKDNFSAYVAADTTYDRGWRDFSSSSLIRRMYVDLGARGDETEFHVSFTGADN